jgi:hypothetical protein
MISSANKRRKGTENKREEIKKKRRKSYE